MAAATVDDRCSADDRRRRTLRRCGIATVLVAAAVSACSSDPTPSLAERLERRYDGDLTCIEAIVSQVDDATASSLADIADRGLDTSGVWYEAPTLDAFGRIIAC